jgi:hypothetical protein
MVRKGWYPEHHELPNKSLRLIFERSDVGADA